MRNAALPGLADLATVVGVAGLSGELAAVVGVAGAGGELAAVIRVAGPGGDTPDHRGISGSPDVQVAGPSG